MIVFLPFPRLFRPKSDWDTTICFFSAPTVMAAVVARIMVRRSWMTPQQSPKRHLSNATSKVFRTDLSEELKEIGFEIFRPIGSLGFFTWRPNGQEIGYETLDTITADDITDSGRLDMNGRPPVLLHIPRIPIPYVFRTWESCNVVPEPFVNQFPYGQLECVHLHAATQRGIDWSTTDFCLGGSSVLTMLADRCRTDRRRRRTTTDDPYFCCKIPHTAGTILVAKCQKYTIDWGDPGHQFEQLVTTGSSSSSSTNNNCAIEFTEHLQQMKVGPFDVLFRAEVDALSAETGLPIEVTTSNPRRTRVVFQMISSGSTVLCHGTRSRSGGFSLVDITTRSLASVARVALDNQKRMKRLEANILKSLYDIQQHMEWCDDGVAQKIDFVGSTTKLARVGPPEAERFLPNVNVMKTLLTQPTNNSTRGF
jgi:hypothetical protein